MELIIIPDSSAIHKLFFRQGIKDRKHLQITFAGFIGLFFVMLLLILSFYAVPLALSARICGNTAITRKADRTGIGVASIGPTPCRILSETRLHAVIEWAPQTDSTGIDVGVKMEIYKLIDRLANDGKANFICAGPVAQKSSETLNKHMLSLFGCRIDKSSVPNSVLFALV
jgi:hypothetical protein